MTSVKKTQFAQILAEKLNIPKKQALEFMDTFMDEVVRIMKKGDKLNLSGFGIFKVADRKAREGRNPRTGESIHIPASKKAKFVPAKALKEAVL
ncbi:MAG: non-specific DNA-binding protein [Parcubacteria group bacterium Licking1014_17]|nr:MAG: non-specific DNA-binding protein [Parcubacteria group bacterium Licking1014_17]